MCALADPPTRGTVENLSDSLDVDVDVDDDDLLVTALEDFDDDVYAPVLKEYDQQNSGPPILTTLTEGAPPTLMIPGTAPTAAVGGALAALGGAKQPFAAQRGAPPLAAAKDGAPRREQSGLGGATRAFDALADAHQTVGAVDADNVVAQEEAAAAGAPQGTPMSRAVATLPPGMQALMAAAATPALKLSELTVTPETQKYLNWGQQTFYNEERGFFFYYKDARFKADNFLIAVLQITVADTAKSMPMHVRARVHMQNGDVYLDGSEVLQFKHDTWPKFVPLNKTTLEARAHFRLDCITNYTKRPTRPGVRVEFMVHDARGPREEFVSTFTQSIHVLSKHSTHRDNNKRARAGNDDSSDGDDGGGGGGGGAPKTQKLTARARMSALQQELADQQQRIANQQQQLADQQKQITDQQQQLKSQHNQMIAVVTLCRYQASREQAMLDRIDRLEKREAQKPSEPPTLAVPTPAMVPEGL